MKEPTVKQVAIGHMVATGWATAQAVARDVQDRHKGTIVRPSVTPWGTGPEDLEDLDSLPPVTFLVCLPDDSLTTCKASIQESVEGMAARLEALIVAAVPAFGASRRLSLS